MYDNYRLTGIGKEKVEELMLELGLTDIQVFNFAIDLFHGMHKNIVANPNIDQFVVTRGVWDDGLRKTRIAKP